VKFFDRLRNRPSSEAQAPDGDHPEPTAGEPIPGYDRMKPDEIVPHLRELKQEQLEEVETYERSHEDRKAVLDKLRYMRSAEPAEGYDELSFEQISEVLKGADGQQVKAIRDYERKFQHRRQVLDEAARVLPEARESRANAAAREEKAARVETGMRKAPGKHRD
jgi:uncharacterized protein (DUF433 family)